MQFENVLSVLVWVAPDIVQSVCGDVVVHFNTAV